jgi:hypothetical protein
MTQNPSSIDSKSERYRASLARSAASTRCRCTTSVPSAPSVAASTAAGVGPPGASEGGGNSRGTDIGAAGTGEKGAGGAPGSAGCCRTGRI